MPSESDRRDALTVALTALLAALPGALPGAEYYLDNAPHVLEVALLANEILPAERWFMGWTDGANTGMALGQLNAPLAWVPLALLVKLGLPVAGLTRLMGVVGNVVFALGAWRLARCLLADRRAALLAAALAATSPIDLWGVGGALGGMWPYRLANGVLLLGLAAAPARRTAGTVGLWLATLLMLHTFTGQAAFYFGALAGLYALWTRDWRAAAHLAGGAALALLATAVFWLPLLDPKLRGFVTMWRTAPWEMLALLTVPVEVYGVRMRDELVVLGGGLGWLHATVLLGGAALGLLRARLADPVRTRLLGAAVVLLAILVVLMHNTGLDLMGPNPWRHLAHWRVALAIAAGAGLVTLLPRSPALPALVGLLLALLSATIGHQQVPHRLRADASAALSALEATWSELLAQGPVGRVYQVDTFRSPSAPAVLGWSHPGGVPAARHDVDLVGSWYGVTPVPSVYGAASEAGILLGEGRQAVTADPGLAPWLAHRLRLYGVDAVVTVDVEMGAALDADPTFTLVSQHLPFAAFRLADSGFERLGARPPAQVEELELERGRASATLTGDGPIAFRLRESHHPWWEASLDGQPVALAEDPSSGLIVGEAPGPGSLVLTWRDRGRRWWPLSALGLSLLGAALARARRP